MWQRRSARFGESGGSGRWARGGRRGCRCDFSGSRCRPFEYTRHDGGRRDGGTDDCKVDRDHVDLTNAERNSDRGVEKSGGAPGVIEEE